jgi:hypothetical protein
MAVVTVPSLWVPPPHYSVGASPLVLGNTAALNASGDKYGWVFRAPKTGNIRRVGFRIGGTVTTATDTDVRVETVAAQIPTGTLKGVTTNGTIAAASITTNTFVYATLTADAAVTVNDLLAISVAPSGSPNYVLSLIYGTVTIAQLPYNVDGSTGTFAAANGLPTFAIEYDDGSYGTIPGTAPISALTTTTFNSASNPEIVGLKFKLLAPFRVCGGWIAIDLDNTTDLVLYDSDGTTPLQTATVTNDGRLSTVGRSPYFFKFPAAQSLLANTFYYLAVKPGASNISVYDFTVASAAVLDQFEGGQNFHHATFHTNTWTPLTTRRTLIGLEIDGIDDGAGGGGGASTWWGA